MPLPTAALAGSIGGAKGASLPALSLGIFLVGAGSLFGAVSSMQAGRAAQQNSAMQAELFRREAEQRRQISERDAEAFRKRQSRLQGTLRARIGGSGVTMEGTPLMVAEDIAAESELQRLRILHGGAADESRLLTQASLERFAGQNARRQGNLRAGSLLLKGAGQMFGT